MSITLVNDIELLKEEKAEIQTRTTETMSSLLRDLTDMGVAVNPDVPYEAGIKVKVCNSSMFDPFSMFDSHWKDSACHPLYIYTHFIHFLLTRIIIGRQL